MGWGARGGGRGGAGRDAPWMSQDPCVYTRVALWHAPFKFESGSLCIPDDIDRNTIDYGYVRNEKVMKGG